MPLSSNSLFHFTSKGLDVLKLIVATGFRPSYVSELNVARNVSGGGDFLSVNHNSIYNSGGYVEYYHDFPVISFCDIPIMAVNSHALKYSNTNTSSNQKEIYAIGLTKEWAMENEILPVAYYTPSSKILKALNKMVEYAKIETDAPAPGYNYIPPVKYYPPVEMGTGPLIRDNQGSVYPFQTLYSKPIAQAFDHHFENYQDEKEWRYVPENAMIISRKKLMRSTINPQTYDIENQHSNNAVEEAKSMNAYQNLEFQPEDISHIILNKEEEIPEFLNFLDQTYSPEHDQNTIRILISKVTSYERILNDYSYS